MNSSRLNRKFMGGSAPMDSSRKKVRKPYTMTKSRESWSDEEHDKFVEALHMFGRDWKKIEDFVGSKSAVQIRSHAQKYFLKLQKSGAISPYPPPRPKRKATHTCPQKAAKNASMIHPSTLCSVASSLFQWGDSSMLMNTTSNGSMSFQDEYATVYSFEDSADISSASVGNLGNNIYSCTASSSITLGDSDTPNQDSLIHESVDISSATVGSLANNVNSCNGSSSIALPNSDTSKQDSLFHGMPDFAELYSFIGSVFDPDTKGHLQKLKQMDSVNLKTVMILMKNLTINLSTSEF